MVAVFPDLTPGAETQPLRATRNDGALSLRTRSARCLRAREGSGLGGSEGWQRQGTALHAAQQAGHHGAGSPVWHSGSAVPLLPH